MRGSSTTTPSTGAGASMPRSRSLERATSASGVCPSRGWQAIPVRATMLCARSRSIKFRLIAEPRSGGVAGKKIS
jgi:hypothetical protein